MGFITAILLQETNPLINQGSFTVTFCRQVYQDKINFACNLAVQQN